MSTVGADAWTIVEAVTRGDVRAVEVLDEHLARIEELNPIRLVPAPPRSARRSPRVRTRVRSPGCRWA